MLLFVSVQFSCGVRESGSGGKFTLSLSSYFVGIRYSVVRISAVYSN